MTLKKRIGMLVAIVAMGLLGMGWLNFTASNRLKKQVFRDLEANSHLLNDTLQHVDDTVKITFDQVQKMTHDSTDEIVKSISLIGDSGVAMLQQTVTLLGLVSRIDTTAGDVRNASLEEAHEILEEYMNEENAALYQDWMKLVEKGSALTEAERRAKKEKRSELGEALTMEVQGMSDAMKDLVDSVLADSKASVINIVDKNSAAQAEIANLLVDNNTILTKEAKSLGTQLAKKIRQMQNITLIVSPILIVIIVIIGWRLGRTITLPILDYVGFTNLLAGGDFSRDVPAVLKRRSDEIGDLARAYQTFVNHIRDLLTRISGGVQTLASASTELFAVSTQMATGVNNMADKSLAVASAAEKTSVDRASVVSGMEEANVNLGNVSAATEEMTTTAAEIASSAETARSITARAMTEYDAVSLVMKELGSAAQQIGKVTETISDISAQTNLLALNATIEAASAGAAGKGFAVVAGEIKDLARQTTEATNDIRGKIDAIQGSSSTAITDMDSIAGIIQNVSDIVLQMASAIEEQSVTTRDMARNIAHAASEVNDATERVGQSAGGAMKAAKDMADINDTITEIKMGGQQTQKSAEELSTLAEQLKTLIDQFKIN